MSNTPEKAEMEQVGGNIKDMTTGSVFKQITLFAIPLLIGNLFQQFYNIADSIVVGQFVGRTALAAVSASGPMVFLLTSLMLGIGMGAAVVISQFFGSKNYALMRRAASSTAVFAVIIGVILTIAGLILTDPILDMLQVPASVRPEAAEYMRITFIGLVFSIMYNMLTSALRALGDSKTPLYVLLLASLLNVGLDVLFVAVFHMGVSGVAWATMIAQLSTAVACYLYMYFKVPLLKFGIKDIVFDAKIFFSIVKYGIPSGLQQFILSVGFVAVQSLVNSYDDVVMSAYAAASRIDQFAVLPMMSVGLALSTFTSQNMGAKNFNRIKEGFRKTIVLVFICWVVTAALIFILGAPMIRLFLTASDPHIEEVVEIGMQYLHVIAFTGFLMGVMFAVTHLLRGAGDTLSSSVFTFINFAIRLGVAYVLAMCTPMGYNGIWWSLPCGWLLSTIAAYVRYRGGAWKVKGIAEI